MHPVLYRLGGFTIQSFGLMLALGVLFGSYLAIRRAGKFYGEKVWDFCFWAVLAGIIGSRLWEIAFTWEQYRSNPWEIFAIWQGGLSIQGGILGGVLVGVWWTYREKIPFWTFADLIVPGILLGQALGRLGCFLAGDDYGVPTSSWLGVIYAPGSPAYGVYSNTPLVPAELMEGIWDLILIGVLLGIERFKVNKFSGLNFALYLGLYSTGRIVLENYRDYGLVVAGGLRTAQIAGVLGVIAALVIIIVRHKKPIELPQPLRID